MLKVENILRYFNSFNLRLQLLFDETIEMKNFVDTNYKSSNYKLQ